MAAMKRGLGRGLDALLSTVEQVHEPVASEAPVVLDGYRMLSVDAIQRGRYQPRRDLEPGALEELADSIRAQGIMQPIVVRSVEGKDRFEIIAGERRWRAGQMAGLTEIPGPGHGDALLHGEVYDAAFQRLRIVAITEEWHGP